MAKETAEQKLLKLIEATQKQDGSAAPAAAPAAAAMANTGTASRVAEAQKIFQSVSAVSVQGIALPPFLLQILSLFKGSGKPQSFGLRQVNTLFLVGVLAFALILAVDLTRGMNKSKVEIQAALKEVRSGKAGLHGAMWEPPIAEFNEYAQIFSSRSLFQPYDRKAIEAAAAKVVEEKSPLEKISDQTRDLKLVGISWLDTPESASAMIENTASGTTYFLGIGDRIQNLTVKKIYADSIVIGLDNEEMEMRL